MKILVVLEPGEPSVEDPASPLRWALARCGDSDVEIRVVLVGHIDGPESRSMEADARQRLRAANQDVEVLHLGGQPEREILRFLGRETFDAMVLAGGTRTPAGKIRPGRLAEQLVLDAPVTLTLVR